MPFGNFIKYVIWSLLSHRKCVNCHSQGKQPVQKHKQNEKWKTLIILMLGVLPQLSVFTT